MKYKFVNSTAKKDKPCYACSIPMQSGEDIVIMQEILNFAKFELLCSSCGRELAKQQSLAQAETKEELPESLKERIDMIIRQLEELKNGL